ncbi:hypothetical protein A3B05_00515 [Candidatus Giovannonibacteria bacterium RIFCSPLOWO2_01_FULL_43_160]|uniref:Uncharacterized protein n=2 Tax=Candidatus Giovannoniibacteriota TaxID=1752738 RepID=A0A0G1IVG7_9BACT|nr:MAG: hypothetical protein UV72_C0009G0006 [Candidatus Giovannonibacteria bacterium GW2011_GWB1_43_13]KKS98459.1 MAG: hypothetical protein UV75_C0017G0003 [Candidatus Giovannonibacteria bacterium GW2011_GWA1_43_15]KKT20925.1 MAG: hypothetical protein UW05_C0023G0003 [Candidatus Giovannonibacteria bacterium GW2011_GWC2_43_8]KKT62963.1 MAG: hypothetical protein UW55_C0007G0003 [Candidatus Giovannonibacteria bacterium GW2011_GWA2_44_26]OGF58355.1 MAG: hypothetical protein A2652_00965 [Candidatus
MADQKDILERVSELPDDLRKALFARSTTDTIQVVGKNAGLSIDKIGELADETGRVMLGITSPSDYVKNLVSRLSVNQEKAKAIAEEINQKVFQPVRESLKKIHGIETPPPAPPLSMGGERVEISPPLQGGVRGGKEIEIKPQPKPLPKREDIETQKPKTEEAKTAFQAPRSTFQEVIPPIFVKKMPTPIASQLGGQAPPDILPAPKESLPQNFLAAKTELEKALSSQPARNATQGVAGGYKDKDPYREIIEP